jgi:hypothetical protein
MLGSQTQVVTEDLLQRLAVQLTTRPELPQQPEDRLEIILYALPDLNHGPLMITRGAARRKTRLSWGSHLYS